MSTSNCNDFITADEGRELKRRIEQLEQSVEQLTTLIDSNLSVTVDAAVVDSDALVIGVQVGNQADTAVVQLPAPDLLVEMEADMYENSLYIETKVGDRIGRTYVDLPLEVTVSTTDIGDDYRRLIVQVGDNFDESEFSIASQQEDADSLLDTSLRLDGSFRNNILSLTVINGRNRYTEQIYIPITDGLQTIFTTEQIYMNCNELENLINNRFEQLDLQLANLNLNAPVVDLSDVLSAITSVENQVNQVKDVVTFKLTFETDNMTYRITPEAQGAWRLRSSVTKQPVQLANYKRYIPSFLIEGTFQSQFVAVGIRVTASGENWRFGGFLAQEFNFDSSGYREANRAFFCTEELLINNVTVLELPVITDRPYRLRYFPPTWFRDLTLQIWEYTGAVTGGSDNGSPDVSAELQSIKDLVSVGFINLNNRFDREDVPAKLVDISRRLERIEQRLGSDITDDRLTTQSPPGRFFFFS